MPAHLDGVAALALDAAGLALASGGHDCSVRFWDVLGQDAKNGNGDKPAPFTKETGRVAWLLWRSAYFTRTLSVRNKILVPFYWFLNCEYLVPVALLGLQSRNER